MAESQVPYPYLPAQVDAIRASLSEPRFGAYLSKGGNDTGYALALYLYNARLAKAFLYPLHVVEVTLRNAIDGLLVSRYGQTWPHEAALRDGLLTDAGRATLDKAIGRAGAGASRGQIVAELTFDFWSHLLRPEYHALWRTALNIVFPHARPPVEGRQPAAVAAAWPASRGARARAASERRRRAGVVVGQRPGRAPQQRRSVVVGVRYDAARAGHDRRAPVESAMIQSSAHFG